MSEVLGEPHALTGVRPTGVLTIGNYLGAIKPIVDMQNTFDGDVSIFVADIHGLTDQEPDTVIGNTLNSARSLLASGIDPLRSSLYLQSQVESESIWLAHMLDRHTTPSELARIPTLKDKLRNGATADTVNMALFRYPILMAADIAIQDATHVPVGEDQVPHIEFTRRIVRRINHAYGEGRPILVEPHEMAEEPIRIAALQEKHGKMSKSEPSSAILLQDKADDVARKIKKAQTASPGELLPILESHFSMAESLSSTDIQRKDLAELHSRHGEGKAVMGDFKNLWADIVIEFLTDFREKYDSISDATVKKTLAESSEQAKHRARAVVERTKRALGFIAII